jgi:hypothetical protein
VLCRRIASPSILASIGDVRRSHSARRGAPRAIGHACSNARVVGHARSNARVATARRYLTV